MTKAEQAALIADLKKELEFAHKLNAAQAETIKAQRELIESRKRPEESIAGRKFRETLERIMREKARKEPSPAGPLPFKAPFGYPISGEPYVGGHAYHDGKRFASVSITNEGSEGEPTGFEVTKRTLELVPA
ncbi:MAG: hypothetical protein KDB07_04005 [Planctomycetes bacterium]|nr:hypothetical protein [Planctomycetota bacterium]